MALTNSFTIHTTFISYENMKNRKNTKLDLKNQVNFLDKKINASKKYGDWEAEAVLIRTQRRLLNTLKEIKEYQADSKE